VYNTILKRLTNPIYAGSYAYGRTQSTLTFKDGKKEMNRGLPLHQDDGSVLIHNHHEGYISWDTYEINQKIMTDNANMKGIMVRGSVKKGCALLVGILRCGHCGRKMLVHYSNNIIRYQCKGAMLNHGTARCISFGGLRIDEAISHSILAVLSPLGIDGALQAAQTLDQKRSDVRQQRELALQ